MKTENVTSIGRTRQRDRKGERNRKRKGSDGATENKPYTQETTSTINETTKFWRRSRSLLLLVLLLLLLLLLVLLLILVLAYDSQTT